MIKGTYGPTTKTNCASSVTTAELSGNKSKRSTIRSKLNEPGKMIRGY